LKRRKFIQTSSLAALASTSQLAFSRAANSKKRKSFSLDFAPHFGMFTSSAGDSLRSQLEFMVDQGFRSIEDNEMKNRSIEEQEMIGNFLATHSMTMGVFVAHKIYWKEPNLASGNKEWREEFLNDIRESVTVAKRINAKWMTIVPGHLALNTAHEYQTANVVESLKQAAAILEPHGLVMVLEPLNFMNHPGLFLTDSPQAYQICKAVTSPSCKILFDIYHQQIQEGNLIHNIKTCWDEIAYFQIGDNPGRNEPTTGEINYKNVFKFIQDQEYQGVLGMEHGNSVDGKTGEKKVIEAYREVDPV